MIVFPTLPGEYKRLSTNAYSFVDDIILIEKSKEVNSKLELWRQTLESKGFRLSRNKTRYMHYDFNEKQEKNDLKVKIREDFKPQISRLKYL